MKKKSLIPVLLLVCVTLAHTEQRAQESRGTYEISGRVVNALTGEVVRKATVTITPSAQRGDGQHYDVEDGTFQFRSLTPGKYMLSAQARGFTLQAYEGHAGFSTAIVVGPDKTSTGIIFRLRPDGSILGQVLDEHNEPVREAHVLLFEKATDMGTRMVERRGQRQTDDQGQYQFHHLHPGTYYLAVATQPWYRRYLQVGGRRVGFVGQEQKPTLDPALDVAYPITYYPGATDAEDAGAILLRPGDRISANFDLAPVPSVHVTIRGANADDGRRVTQPNFRPRVFGFESGVFLQPSVNWKDGEVEVSGLAPGDYALSLMRFDGGERNNRAQDISLQGNTELDALGATGLEAVHGKLTFEGSQPPRNAFLQFRDLSTGDPLGARVDENGEFTLQPRHVGRYVVSLTNAPGYAIRAISATGARMNGRTITISGQATELAITASQGVGTINGIVTKDAEPVSGTMVVLVPQDIADNVSLFRRDQSDSDGTFTLSDVVPGRYTAIAIQNGWDMEWASPDALRPYLAKGTPVQIDGKQKLDIEVVAQ